MSFDQGTLDRHGLTPDEYKRIVGTLGREPTLTELGIFSVMWSEHCSYKSSRVYLRRLPTTGPRVLQGPGENAGAVDIGDGLAAVFKIESHNHPSFIEPYQGAATGVGGIIRDIFTMGARPVALLNSLRFGPLDEPRSRGLLEGVVAGISGYGNSMGIATIGGEVAFEECYAGNPLVNVLCLGLGRADRLVKASASGVGNPVYYVGAKTGRDGIHGATMASAEFDERSAEKRPAVQVGDPFMEKLLMEACLELMQTDAFVGVQDMGAAGLTCSTSEMGARGGSGIEIDVSQVPRRETGMTPYEIMLSESQERMLLVIRRGREAEVERIFEKWDLHAERIGEVTNNGRLRVKDRGNVVADIPNAALVDEAPVYRRPAAPPAGLDAAREVSSKTIERAPDAAASFQMLLQSPAIASKRWIYRQYDHMIGTSSLVLDGRGAGVLRVKGTNRALAMSVDGNGRYCSLDPKLGAMLAVAEAARNVACAGAVPIGATNCLNFGSPERPEIMWQFAEVIDGIREACLALDISITGGNVSFYNETDGKAIYPTPVIGVVGLIEDATCSLARMFPEPDLVIVVLGENRGELGASEYLKVVHGRIAGVPPMIDLRLERAAQSVVARAAAMGVVRSAHDCSDGGVAMALAECCFDAEGRGASLQLSSVALEGWDGHRVAATLFGESASRIVVSARPSSVDELLALASASNVPVQVVGRTGGSRLTITVDGVTAIDVAVSDAEQAWAGALERRMTTAHAA